MAEALRSIIENDRTYYEHHEPRRDGKLPREDGGTIWKTPRQIATAALSAYEAAETPTAAPGIVEAAAWVMREIEVGNNPPHAAVVLAKWVRALLAAAPTDKETL